MKALENKLNEVWNGSYKLYANLAHFKRSKVTFNDAIPKSSKVISERKPHNLQRLSYANAIQKSILVVQNMMKGGSRWTPQQVNLQVTSNKEYSWLNDCYVGEVGSVTYIPRLSKKANDPSIVDIGVNDEKSAVKTGSCKMSMEALVNLDPCASQTTPLDKSANRRDLESMGIVQ
ncbi:hypothetical protein Ancab_025348 [Ancistrocladus abbreviatus]